jgi:hypothetical protein
MGNLKLALLSASLSVKIPHFYENIGMTKRLSHARVGGNPHLNATEQYSRKHFAKAKKRFAYSGFPPARK